MPIYMIKTIAFDADDTLWINEPYFRDAERQFLALMSSYVPEQTALDALTEIELKNISIYGYGAKGFTFSMLETALQLCKEELPGQTTRKILELGRSLMSVPIRLLDGVEETLEYLAPKYRIVLATKGDLLDQQHKLERSGLGHYFEHVEVMSEKDQKSYTRLMQKLRLPSREFMMVGNSARSDILPVLEIGAYAVHIPYHVTWCHEMVEGPIKHARYRRLDSVRELTTFL